MKKTLDDVNALKKLDENEMLKTIFDFPESAVKFIKETREIDLVHLTKIKFNALVIIGMGGSAVGGLLLRDWLQETSKIPIYVSRGYHLPSWVDTNTLVFVVSYSGNTEETISQMMEAREKNCKMVAFTSGGMISKIASHKNIPCLIFPSGYQPRAAIAFQFFGLAEIARKFGLTEPVWKEVEETIKIISKLRDEMDVVVETKNNLGKQLALKIFSYMPMIYGNRMLSSVVYRYSTQFNENSKVPAGYGFFPEAFHNSVMACESTNILLKNLCAIIIRDPKENKEMSKKITKFSNLLAESFGRVIEVKAIGKGRLCRMLSALYIGDYTSVYLGLLYGLDPSSTKSINILKS
jgi:glucose/mannose-6-phosphate isomerase